MPSLSVYQTSGREQRGVAGPQAGINVSTLSMTDKDRMDVVDDCYASMRRYRNLVNYYTNRNIAVSFLRARKKNDLDRVLKLYGNDTSKYW